MSTVTLLSSYLDDGGWHTEAENVRNGVDLESYENELSLIVWLLRHTGLAQPAQSVDVAAKDAEIERLAETKLAYLRERGYTQQAVVMTGPGGCCTVSNLGRVIWLKDPSELAITGAERTAKQIHDEAGIQPNP